MDEEETAEILLSVERMLEIHGLSALVVQERMAAAEGRPVEVTRENIGRPSGGRKRLDEPAIGDVRREPVTNSERLANLLDLLEIAVGGTFALEERVLGMAEEMLHLEPSDQAAVSFAAPPEEMSMFGEDRQWFIPTLQDIEGRRESVGTALQIIDELRDQVGTTRSRWLDVASELAPTRSDRVGGWA